MPMGLRPVDDPVTEKPAPANPLAQAQPAPAPLPPAAPAPAPAAFAPANDDRQKDFRAAVGRMNRRPSTAIYWLMALLSLAWVAGGLWLAHLFYGAQFWQLRSGAAARRTALGARAGRGHRRAGDPVLAFAVMVRRAQEMRLAAQSMGELALRLAEPESLAQDRVMMVGQAVRREVAAMGEGIERTLARAVELETLVHTEVNELERAYAQNEMRIRTARRWPGQRARRA